MPLDGASIHFHYSGAGSLLGSQSDPNASLGNWIASASDRLYHTQTTVGAFLTDNFVIRSSTGSLPGPPPSFVGHWLLMVTGAAFGLAAKIVFHYVIGPNTYIHFDRPITGAIAGDTFRIHAPHNLFDEITAAEALAGEDEYRAIYVRNETGVTLNALRFYFSLPNGGAPVPAMAAKNGALSNIGAVANEDTAPVLSTSLSDANARFETRYLYSNSYPGSPANLTTANQQPIWLRRTVPSRTGKQADIVWAIVVEGTNTGGDPDPIRSMALVVFNGQGLTSVLSVQEDRYATIGGGARVTATVQDTNGSPLEEFDLEWTLTGLGSLDTTNGQTDEDGETTVAYTAPTDPAQAGQAATVTAKVL